MEVYKLKDMKGGWFVCNFEPHVFHTDQFEVGYHKYKKGQEWPAHIHKRTTEINYLVKGKMTINGRLLKGGDIFVIYPNEVSSPVYLTDCEIVITRNGSFPNDKYIVKDGYIQPQP